jgi:apolipoprotein N-acyltransferase
LFDRTPANRSFLQVAAVAALVFIGAALIVLSSSPAGFLGSAMSALLALAWLTACCSLAGLALATSGR